MHPLSAVTDLQGNAESQGDLKSIVLHKMAISAQKNTFPVALGVRITGVDDSTFSQTGEAYSAISLPATDLHTARTLQEDDTALAYEFARKFVRPALRKSEPLPSLTTAPLLRSPAIRRTTWPRKA